MLVFSFLPHLNMLNLQDMDSWNNCHSKNIWISLSFHVCYYQCSNYREKKTQDLSQKEKTWLIFFTGYFFVCPFNHSFFSPNMNLNQRRCLHVRRLINDIQQRFIFHILVMLICHDICSSWKRKDVLILSNMFQETSEWKCFKMPWEKRQCSISDFLLFVHL